MKTTINLTDGHIEAGRPFRCLLCPVARAISEVLNPKAWTSVQGIYAELHIGEEWEPVDLPDEVSGFICAFDDGRDVEPFAFELDIPAKFLKEVAA